MSKFCYELRFGTDFVTAEVWQEFLLNLRHNLGVLAKYRIIVRRKAATWYFYLMTERQLPSCLGLNEIFLTPLNSDDKNPTFPPVHKSKRPYLNTSENLVALAQKMACRGRHLAGLELIFPAGPKATFGQAYLYAEPNLHKVRLAIFAPAQLLVIDFSKQRDFCYRKAQKFCQMDKILPILNSDAADALVQAKNFPYSQQDFFLHLDDYDFTKHSLLIGSSGAGKSKFLALWIKTLAQKSTSDYRVISELK